MNFVDIEKKWITVLSKPDWYQVILPDIEELKREAGILGEEKLKGQLYDFFERHLAAADFALGNEVGDLDVERNLIDTVVIHHTSNPPGMSKERLSAIELLRLYAPQFLSPSNKDDEWMRGKPVHSGHTRNGKQVFWPYHWFVRQDGSTERLLEDDEIGWHAGNWKINCRSIAICLDADHEDSIPSAKELDAIAKLIKEYYSQGTFPNLLGHREVNPKTTCPSNLFLGPGGWKEELIEKLK